MSIRRDLEKRAQEAILKNIIENYKQNHSNWLKDPAIRKTLFNYAFFKPANALLIAAVILAAGCLPLFVVPLLFPAASPLWLGLGALIPIVLGLLAEIGFLTMSFKDEKAHAQAVAHLLEPQVKAFKPATIRDEELRAKVDTALEYWSLINDAAQQVPKGILRENTPYEVTHQEMTDWLQAVYNLAERVDKFRINKVIKRDLAQMPAAIAKYEKQLNKETKPAMKEQLKRTIEDKKRQFQTLQKLENNMEQAVYQLDSTISALGTIYPQLLLLGSQSESGSRANRLQEEISEQVHQLEDMTEAMDEVYQGSF